MLEPHQIHKFLTELIEIKHIESDKPSYAYEHYLGDQYYVYVKRYVKKQPLVLHPIDVKQHKKEITEINGIKTDWLLNNNTSYRTYPTADTGSQQGYAFDIESFDALVKLLSIIGFRKYFSPSFLIPDVVTHCKEELHMSSLNQILYGPPGTGKTFTTINEALKIVVPDFYETNINDRDKLKARFDELITTNRIGFVTFHQSFSYEDFVEGLKANTENNQISYEIEDGIFKRMCEAAIAKPVIKTNQSSLDISKRNIWKMSLGDTSGEDAFIYQQCIDNNYILLGYGYDINFYGANNRNEIAKYYRNHGVEIVNESSDYQITSVEHFKNRMKIGDLVIVSDGNHKFRAIGEITGDYQFNNKLIEDEGYSQYREVKWHRVYEPSLPIDELFKKNLSQMTLYRLYDSTIDLTKLEVLLSENSEQLKSELENRVLIIDEINRGNISNIFGELITLIEPSKRAGAKEALSVKLPYSKESFSVPANLHIIGTMNTADKSLAQVDIALRRRFEFVEMMPNHQALEDINIEGINIAELLKTINQRIELLYDREHTIGHSFFLPLKNDPTIERLARIFELEILPLLEEYFFEDWERVGQVLGDHLKSDPTMCFIKQKFSKQDINSLMGNNWDQSELQRYERNTKALLTPKAYIGIYDSIKNGFDHD